MKSVYLSPAVPALSLLLSGCGASSPKPEPTPLPAAGSYRLVELYDDSGTPLNSELSELQSGGNTVTLTLSEDGSGTYIIFDESEPVTWTETTLTFNGEILDMEWTPERLTVYSGGGTDGRMVFVPEKQ